MPHRALKFKAELRSVECVYRVSETGYWDEDEDIDGETGPHRHLNKLEESFRSFWPSIERFTGRAVIM
jgi:hypothetical protein